MTEAEWKEFLEELPPHVRAVAERYPMTSCFRSTQDPAYHYKIRSYDADHKSVTVPVTVTLIHGRDSMHPGIATFGQPPEQLIRCDCGKWLPPTREQIKEMGEEIARERARMRRH